MSSKFKDTDYSSKFIDLENQDVNQSLIEQPDLKLPLIEKSINHHRQGFKVLYNLTSILIRSIIIILVSITTTTLLCLSLRRGLNRNELYHRSLPLSDDPQSQRDKPNIAIGKIGAVASEEIRCSNIGLEVLKENGTATDAAIATAICTGVVNCFSSGIGGGGFMVIKPALCRNRPDCQDQDPISIDFRETSPSGSSYLEKFKKDPELSKYGGLSVAIPGELAGFYEAYRLHGGGVSWKRLFEPSIELAKNFSVGERLGRMIYDDYGKNHSIWMRKSKAWSEIFFPNNRTVIRSGDYIQRVNYSNTLQLVADQGIQVFYSGQIAHQLVETINGDGGDVSVKDFSDYRPIVKRALKSSYLDRTFYTTHAPSSGPLLIYLLNILENYQMRGTDRTPLSEHRLIEALKYTAAARTLLGDPNFLNVTEILRFKKFTSKKFANEVFKKIDDERTYDFQHYNPHYDLLEDHGTTHLTVIDRRGSTVSLTSTVNLIFGSELMDQRTGIILNDELDDFSVPGRSNDFNLSPSPLNYPEKGKRPISSISPVIFDGPDGELWCSLGGSGGSRILSAIASTILKLDWGIDLLNSIDDFRLHHQLLPNEVMVEKGYSSEYTDYFKSLGHNISYVDYLPGKSAVQGIIRTKFPNNSELDSQGTLAQDFHELEDVQDDGYFLVAVSDDRKRGVPAAY
ncbi:gamma-glutamyltranspeptidase-domain-containing protein [Phakopsora pachyrhizi]|nr:gamma-glutamyltranspeptidase-domain-containing protein [Phakopsora pachyrhizi]